MNETEIYDICMRIGEFNLKANNYFDMGIFGCDVKIEKQLEVDREKIITYINFKYPKVNVNKLLRKLKMYDSKGEVNGNMPTDVKILKEMILLEG